MFRLGSPLWVAQFFYSISGAYSPLKFFYRFYGCGVKLCITFAIEKDEQLKTNNKNFKIMDKYTCIPCGWVYDPAKGDPENGIAPGTSFDDLPEDWACPICGADKTQFEKE